MLNVETAAVVVKVGVNNYNLTQLVLAVQGVQEEVFKSTEIEYIETPVIGESKSILATKKDGVTYIFHNAQLFRSLLAKDNKATVRMLTSYSMKKARF